MPQIPFFAKQDSCISVSDYLQDSLVGGYTHDPCSRSCDIVAEAGACSTIYTLQWARWISEIVRENCSNFKRAELQVSSHRANNMSIVHKHVYMPYTGYYAKCNVKTCCFMQASRVGTEQWYIRKWELTNHSGYLNIRKNKILSITKL